jgi:hypothetical protein
MSAINTTATLFNVPQLKVYALNRGRGRYRHSFGGPPRHAGITPEGGTEPLHLVYTLDLNDPRLGITFPRTRKLPLYYGFVYDGGGVSYQVISEEEIQIVKMESLTSFENYPYKKYPAEFPRHSVSLRRLPFNPKEIEDVQEYSGVFGFDWVAKEDRSEMYQALVQELKHRYDHEQLRPPQTLSEMTRFFYRPFAQGRPAPFCPNSKCPRYNRGKPMLVLAVIEGEPIRGIHLWGKDNDDVWIIFLICPRCHTIQSYNECT